jgi:hypothetical protein
MKKQKTTTTYETHVYLDVCPGAIQGMKKKI